MKDIKNNEFDGLYARLEDLKRRAARGDMGISAFLSPRELHYAQGFLTRQGVSFFGFGGYDGAERQRLYILPEYMEGISSHRELLQFGFSDEIAVIEVRGGGFEKISHRAFMGSLLGLGIERSVVGDIVMLSEDRAIVFCDKGISDFLTLHWERAGRDKIKLVKTSVPEDFAPVRSYAPINDTVASPRLDCVVASLCTLSREKAREAVVTGLAELDYEVESRPDREVCTPCLISVRGYGKFRVLSLSDKTRKGRYRLVGEKFL